MALLSTTIFLLLITLLQTRVLADVRNASEGNSPKIKPYHLLARGRQAMLKIHGAPWHRQRGAIGIMTAVLLPVILGFLALVIETARLYNRKAEMQSLATAVALSAAKQLDGTQNGISSALSAAHDVVEGGYPATMLHYQYTGTMGFSDSALKFGKSSDGSTGWLGAESAKASPAGIAYVKVDTNDLNPAYGTVDTWLAVFLNNAKSTRISHTAVAGKRRLNVVPLAICAMSPDPTNPVDERKDKNGYSELREYGFRRGVSYNLMQLSPNTATAVNYLIDPISLPPHSGYFGTNVIGPYVCTGTVELPKIIGQALNLQSGFPISQLYNQLNSRFDSSNGQCSAVSAPPDSNIKPYPYGSVGWMTKPVVQVPDPAASVNRLETIADTTSSGDLTATRFGPLWVFARAVSWSDYTGQPEPAQGYTPFQATSTIWKSLYNSTGLTVNYPTNGKGVQSPPYFTQVTKPSLHPPGLQYRRVLNVPLLSCPAVGVPGKVVAIGKFFMTIPADKNGIYAEFSGVTLQETAAGPVELNR